MPDDAVDALFTLATEEFTAARDRVVRALRDAGERERAKEVAALRRPTLAAWAVNQAVRADPEAYAALLDAGRELRRAQRRALSGVVGSRLREAGHARQRSVEQLADRAVRLLADAGGDPASHRDAIVSTFAAASASEETGETVRAGRLTRPLTPPSGLDDLAALSVVEPGGGSPDEPDEGTTPAATHEPGVDGDHGERRAAARAVAEAQRHADEAEVARRRARDDARAARRTADAAATEAERALEEADRMLGDADRLRRRADEARERAARRQRRAETEADRARRLSDEADGAEREARRRAGDLARARSRLDALGG